MFPLHVHRLPEDNGATRTSRFFPRPSGRIQHELEISLSPLTQPIRTISKGGSSRALALRALGATRTPSPDDTGHGLYSDFNDDITCTYCD